LNVSPAVSVGDLVSATEDYLKEVHVMAWYVVTNSPDVDWDDDYKYKSRHESQDGSPVAQDEVERRRVAGLPAVLWRWEHGEATLVERYNA
jgi:hypothetical protein